MPDEFPRFTAAAVQAAPVYMDREATIQKGCDLIDRAARGGAQLIVFPETWVPGYPFWAFGSTVFSNDVFLRLYASAVEVGSEAAQALSEAAARAGAHVVMGVNERARRGGTLYNSLLYFDHRGGLMGTHRKLMPTFTERTVWGQGDGSGLRLYDTPLGRLGGLICWEHEMTLVKYAMYARGEQVHASVWPAFSSQNHHIDFGCRQYAFEGACFVVAACGYLTPELVPEELGLRGKAPFDANGGSGIIGPDGEYLAGPLYGKEDILYADIDLAAIVRQKHSRDVGGHYARPDVAQLLLHAQERAPVVYDRVGDGMRAEIDDALLPDGPEAEEAGAERPGRPLPPGRRPTQRRRSHPNP